MSPFKDGFFPSIANTTDHPKSSGTKQPLSLEKNIPKNPHLGSSLPKLCHNVKRKSSSLYGALSGKIRKRKSTPCYSKRTLETASILGLSSTNLRKLNKNFKKIDIDGSGSIDCSEFFRVMGEEQTPLTEELFKLVGAKKDDLIDFEDFVKLCATYCMFSQKDILRFCFDCFDSDSSGFIDENEYKHLCRTINNGSPTFPGNFENALEMFDTNDDGVIDFREFMELDKKYPMLIWPAFRLQENMQNITLGENAWVRVYERVQHCRHLKDFDDMGMPASFGNKRLIPSLPPIFSKRKKEDRHDVCLDRLDAMKRGEGKDVWTKVKQ